MRLSVLVPLYNEEANVTLLVEGVRESLQGSPHEWELVLVDDGSTDRTAEIAGDLSAADPRVSLVKLNRNYGQTAAMMAGFDHARGDVIITMDGDLQNDPRDIPALVAELERGYDLVAGWRERRQDRLLTRKIPSWCANRLIAWITGIPIRDNGCSLKAYRAELLERLTLYSDMHRFIPALAALGGAKIAQIPVLHHPRRFGTSKYGLGRTFRVLADLLTLRMITRFRERPLVGFAIAGAGAFGLALLFALAWLIAFTQFGPEKASALVFPGAAFVWVGVGIYLVMLGLIAEAAVARRRDRKAPLMRELV